MKVWELREELEQLPGEYEVELENAGILDRVEAGDQETVVLVAERGR